MNFTGGNTLPNIARRNWQIATLTGGLALALSAGALAGVFDRGASPAIPSVVRPADPPAISARIAPTTGGPSEAVYFLVGSPAEAAALSSAISTDAAEYGLSEQTANLSIVTLETPEQDAQFATTIGLATPELMAANIGVRVVDLREPSSPSAYAASSGASAPAEAIVYVVGSEAEAVTLRQQLNEAGNEAPGNVVRDVLVIDTANQDLFNTVVGEQMATGSFQVVDLR